MATMRLIVVMLVLTVLMHHDASAMFAGGYVLTNAYGGSKTVLIDSSGKTAYTWDLTTLNPSQGGYSCYLLENGHLLRSAIVTEGSIPTQFAPRQGVIQEIDPKGKLVWEYVLANDTFMLHHDMKPMPNGNILAVSFVIQTKAQMIATNVDSNLVRTMANPKFILSEKIVEIKPTYPSGGTIVWEWRLFDHIVKGDSAKAHPELISGTINPTLFEPYHQWVHLNGLDFNPKMDMVIFSSRLFSELFILDHSTTTQEAAGHTGGKRGKGGDILYRWGKPANYKMTGGTTINILHCVNWIPATYPGGGDIIFFHNGSSRSQVVEVKPPMDDNGVFQSTDGKPFGPDQPTWLYAPTDSFYSFSMSSAFRLPNGNTLAHLAYPSSAGAMNTSGNSLIVEVDNNKKTVAKLTLDLKGDAVEKKNPEKYNPAKIMFYEKDYKGIKALLGGSGVGNKQQNGAAAARAPQLRINQAFNRIEFSNIAGCTIDLFTMQGKKVFSVKSHGMIMSIEKDLVPQGIYCARISRNFVQIENRTINILY
jgi:hypothetical protein